MSVAVAAIDLGASSGRVLRGVVNEGRIEIEECYRFDNEPLWIRGQEREELRWDILSLWAGIRTGLVEASRRGPVDAIGIDTWGVDYGLIDEDGVLLSNPWCYRSDRTEGPIESVHRAMSRRDLYGRNGLHFQSFNTIFQVVADQGRAQTPLARDLLLLPDLLAYWLTGEKVCEVTNASTTGLIDPATRDWSPEILSMLSDQFGVDVPGILPRLVEPGERIGTASVEGIDLRTRAGEPTPVIAVGSHDTASAVVAVPAVARTGTNEDSGEAPSFAFISSGTWSLVGVELTHPVVDDRSFAANFANELGVDGTVRFLKNIMGMWVQQQCIREWRSQGDSGLDWPTLDAATGEAEPFRSLMDLNDPDFMAPGRMNKRLAEHLQSRGEPVPRGHGEVLRTVTDSLVVAYRRALREAQDLSGQPIDAVHMVGGGSLNKLLCQLTADATGLPVIAGPVEGTSVGNMAVQLRAIGVLSGSLTDLRRTILDSIETVRYEPTPGEIDRWDAAERRVFA